VGLWEHALCITQHHHTPAQGVCQLHDIMLAVPACTCGRTQSGAITNTDGYLNRPRCKGVSAVHGVEKELRHCPAKTCQHSLRMSGMVQGSNYWHIRLPHTLLCGPAPTVASACLQRKPLLLPQLRAGMWGRWHSRQNQRGS
jgi:hypothetical protein